MFKMYLKKRMFSMGVVIILLAGMIFSTNPIQAAKSIKSKSVSVNVSTVTIGVGDVISITAKMNPLNSTDKLAWRSSNTSIATVNSYGVVTAKKEGTVTITVTTSSKKTAKVSVKVKKYLTSAEILSLIKSNTISRNDVIKLIQGHSLSENDIIDLIKDYTLSEEDVVAIVSANCMTEEKVKELIAEARDVPIWEDGSELVVLNKQSHKTAVDKNSAPLNMELEYDVLNLRIKKYSVNEDDEGNVARYRYDYEVTIQFDAKVYRDIEDWASENSVSWNFEEQEIVICNNYNQASIWLGFNNRMDDYSTKYETGTWDKSTCSVDIKGSIFSVLDFDTCFFKDIALFSEFCEIDN